MAGVCGADAVDETEQCGATGRTDGVRRVQRGVPPAPVSLVTVLMRRLADKRGCCEAWEGSGEWSIRRGWSAWQWLGVSESG